MSEIHILKHKEPFKINAGSFHIPYTVKWECEECHQLSYLNYDDQSLSYPETGVSFNELLVCDNCDYGIIVDLQVDINLKVIKES